jgi:hypothetical protein
MILSPDCTTSLEVAVTATHAEFAASMAAKDHWVLISNTALWLKQANPSGTITCVAKASMADTDYITINDGTTSVLYEFDTVGDGVTGGRIQVNISGATSATDVATILKAAIVANQSYITVTQASGVLTLASTTKNITITENVANGSFTVVYGPIATAAAGSMYIPANYPVILRGEQGSNVSVLRDSADGKASLTKHFEF